MNRDITWNILESDKVYEEDKEYWLRQFEDGIEFSEFHPDLHINAFGTDSMQFPLAQELSEQLYRMCKNSDLALYSLFLAATLYAVSRFSNNCTPLIGMPALRNGPEIQPVNEIVPVKMNINSFLTVKQFLNQVRDQIKSSVKHSHYPLERIFSLKGVKVNDHRCHPYRIIVGSEKVHGSIVQTDIADQTIINLKQVKQQLCIEVCYNFNRYDKDSVNSWMKKISFILSQMAVMLNDSLSEIGWVDTVEQAAVSSFNNTELPYPTEKLVHSFLEEQATRTPEQCALIFAGQRYSYREINEKSNQLARKLIRKNVCNGSLIALCMERSAEMIISIFAVLKAGAGYVPIDPLYPFHKIESMLSDTAAEILIIKGDQPLFEMNRKLSVVNLADSATYFTGETENLPAQCSSADPAYVIYTSGSTGQAKGVMIEHRALVNRLLWMQKQYPTGPQDVIMQKTTYSFDVSVWEIFLWSLNGASLFLLGAGDEKNPKIIVEEIQKNKISIIHFVPTMLYMFVSMMEPKKAASLLASLRYVFCSGEALTASSVKQFYELFPEQSYPKLINKYGPTEATIDVSYYECSRLEDHRSIPIGAPIYNTKLHIMDAEGRDQGIGAIGELYLSGAGVARGYLNRPVLTNERFVGNARLNGELYYRTGDIARWLPNGNVEYLGRNDAQVKIRGYRIELGEIEAAISRQPQITEAVAVIRNITEHQKDIVVYYSAQGTVGQDELRAHLSFYLPSYMLPARYYQLEHLPLLSNGKIDRNHLPEFECEDIQQKERILPQGSTQQVIYEIWKEVLKVDDFSVDVPFFSLGGDSIKAIRAVSSINTKLQQDISIISLYENDTVMKLSDHILTGIGNDRKKSLAKAYSELEQIRKEIAASGEDKGWDTDVIEDFYPMSDIQLGMVLQSLKTADGAVYHDQHIVKFYDEEFQYEHFQAAVDVLIQRHPLLRTTYNLTDFSNQMQIVYKTITAECRFISLRHLLVSQQTDELSAYMQRDRKQPFISSDSGIPAPLWRITIVELSQHGDFALLLSVHHSIMDGWSVASFMTELTNTYFSLKYGTVMDEPNLKHNYRDYIAEQIWLDQDHTIKDFWKSELADCKLYEPPLSQIGTLETGKQKFAVYDLGMERNTRIREFAKAEGIPARSVCFAAYIFMLYLSTYQRDFTVGLIENNRPLCEDGEKILGCFLNTVPFSVTISKTMSWREFIQTINKKMIQLKHYGRLPVTKIMQHAGNSLIEAYINNFFNYVDFHVYDQLERRLESDWQLGVEEYYKTEIPLDFICMHTPSEFFLKVSYSQEHYTEKQIQNYFTYFEKILCSLLEQPDSMASKTAILQQVYDNTVIKAYQGEVVNYSNYEVISLFEAAVSEQSQHVAIAYQNREITYHEANKEADTIAGLIRRRGIAKGSVIAILIDRSPEMLTSMLGILKAGCGYLPIDPEYPQWRIRYMIENSDAAAIISNRKYAGQYLPLDRTIFIEEIDNACSVGAPLTLMPDDSDIAYMIYTSGSTGKPKGVIINRSSLNNFIAGMKLVLPLEKGKTFLSATTISFDIFVLETLVALSCGMQVLLISKEEQLDMRLLGRIFQQKEINYMQVTPSRLQLLLDDHNVASGIGQLDAIMIGGEHLSESLVSKVQATGNMLIFNMYGPTETTVWSTVKELTGVPHVTLGDPIANTQLYIVDENNELQAPEALGELCISGDGLARGYCNAQELTNEKFIPSLLNGMQNMYKTGDMVRRLPSNELVFEGRIDNLVKVRGYRIEPGEIENALIRHVGVKDAIVKALERIEGEKSLTAFYLHEELIAPNDFREKLGDFLPEYMIPSYYVRLSELPLTPNGKIDHNQLSVLARMHNEPTEVIQPKTSTEKVLLDIWREVLQKEQISTTDNFFALGGSSFMIVKVFSKITAELTGSFTIADLFIYSTIASLAGYIDEQNLQVAVERIEMQGVEVSEAYRVQGNKNGSRTTLTVSMEQNQGNDENGINIALLLAYLTMIHEIAVPEEVAVAVVGSTGIRRVSADFAAADSVQQLATTVIRQLTDPDNNHSYGKPARRQHKKSPYVLLPHFANSDQLEQSNADEANYDLFMRYRSENSVVELSLTFNSAVLLQEKMEKLLQGYIRLFKMITFELQNGDE
ncbi:hypothetical protein PMSD_25175 [Paenibacillus macquariensis subsp. defensor]|nr:hypothetical protein PMSD_25175 [Paenibacillus macquariensis subsp. defensor]